MAEETKKTAVSKKPGKLAKIKSFFKETKSEVSKVVWPSPKQMLNNTLIVLSAMILSAVFIGLVDTLFMYLLGLVV